MFKFILILFCLLCFYGKALAGTAPEVDKGKELYHTYGCALCHGRNGQGDGIESQSFNPPPTDFHNLKTYLHGSDRDSIKRSIQDGIKEESSIMPAFEHIPPEEIDKIIDYLQSLQNK